MSVSSIFQALKSVIRLYILICKEKEDLWENRLHLRELKSKFSPWPPAFPQGASQPVAHFWHTSTPCHAVGRHLISIINSGFWIGDFGLL